VCGRAARSTGPSRAVDRRDGLYPPILCPDCAQPPARSHAVPGRSRSGSAYSSRDK
jgi:hypothetical protein